MAGCSVGQLGVLNAEGYAEHINSMGELILTNCNSLLSDDKIDMLVTLQMNNQFMKNMRRHYGNCLQTGELFGMTVLTPATQSKDEMSS